jgi:peptide/nickel transport system permease protein
VDSATRVADMMFSFPPILLGLLVSAILGPGILSAIAAIMLITFPIFVRVVRAATLDVAGRDFVTVSSIIGASFPRRIFVHLLPNVAGAVAVQMVYSISFGMLIESGLSFLGLGVQPPEASLGSLLREGNQYLGVAPWLTFGPGFVLALAILSVNLVGDGLRRIADPLEARALV